MAGLDGLNGLDDARAARASAHAAYAAAGFAQRRDLVLNDLFFLMVHVLGRADMDNDWCFARCREVQRGPDGYLDLWAREHYKSTIITVGKTIQDILANPEITVGIFSHSRPIARSFLAQIKRTFETCENLKELFPDVLHQAPRRESPKWSEDSGLIVKRATNPKEATAEAWGLLAALFLSLACADIAQAGGGGGKSAPKAPKPPAPEPVPDTAPQEAESAAVRDDERRRLRQKKGSGGTVLAPLGGIGGGNSQGGNTLLGQIGRTG
jgi:hypothetical protein